MARAASTPSFDSIAPSAGKIVTASAVASAASSRVEGLGTKVPEETSDLGPAAPQPQPRSHAAHQPTRQQRPPPPPVAPVAAGDEDASGKAAAFCVAAASRSVMTWAWVSSLSVLPCKSSG